MVKRSKRSRKKHASKKRSATLTPAKTTRYLIEKISELDLARWQTTFKALYDIQTLLYFCLEGQRKTHREKISQSLENALIELPFNNWSRVIDYRYSLNPLSTVGSTINFGGRFNFGDIDPNTFLPFPALYIGNNDDTVLSEFFQSGSDSHNGLSRGDLALTRQASYSVVKINGYLSRVFDLRESAVLREFVLLTKTFGLTPTIKRLADSNKIPHPEVIRTVDGMYAAFFEKKWRERPALFDVPANSQVFGRILRDAGFQGVLYRSVRGAGICLAIFPENLGPEDFVELPDGTAPKSVKIQRMDWTTWRHLLEE